MAPPSIVQTDHMKTLTLEEEDETDHTQTIILKEIPETVDSSTPASRPVSPSQNPSPEIPEDPKTWSPARKWTIIGILAWISFIIPLTSSLLASAAPQISKELHITSPALRTFILSGFLLGLAAGPLVLAPLSEVYGRLPLYHISNFFFLVFTLAASFARNGPELVVFRILEGALGTACLTVGGGTITDLVEPERRASVMAFWAAGSLVGPAAGPLVGGVLAEHLGWRAVLWILSGIAVLNIILCALFFRETYKPVLLARKNSLNGQKLRPASFADIRHAMSRPIRMLFGSPVMAIIGIFAATIWGLLYMIFTTMGFVFPQYYGFTETQSGLVYLAPGCGMIVGLLVAGRVSDKLAQRAKAKGQACTAEDRLPRRITISGIAAITGGLLLYGWSVEYRTHFAIPLIGLFILGVGNMWILIAVQQYIVEAFMAYVSSALATMAMLRSLTTGLLPLSGLGLYDSLGIGRGNSILAGIVVVSAILPIICTVWGRQLRERYNVGA